MKFNQEGIPFSLDYQDTYYSVSGPVDESHYVFIQGNQLQRRWGEKDFTIAEIGFGFGLNFITSCQSWLASNSRHSLHYISFEKHPVSGKDLLTCHNNLGIESDLSLLLHDQYPLAVSGIHRIHFYQYNIFLTLVYGDALEYLSDLAFKADCWYLDGFSPSKNQTLWSMEIAGEIYRLTKPGGTFSTYSAATQVKNNFSAAGFSVTKKPGFHNKREMLTGVCVDKEPQSEFHYREQSWFNLPSTAAHEKTVTIIGAGLAGICTAAALARRNWHVTVIDKHSSPATEGSGNKNAILMPRLSVDHDSQSQLTLAGFLYSLRFLQSLKEQDPSLHWEQCGAIQIPRDHKQQLRMEQLLVQGNIPSELLYAVDGSEIQSLTECACANGGWYIPLACWTVPAEICRTLLTVHQDNIEFIGNTDVSSITQKDDVWTIVDQNNHIIRTSHYVLIANAGHASCFTQTQWCKTYPKRGQLTYLPKSASNIHPSKIICSDAYITPATENHYVLGASFITGDTSREIRKSEHLNNLARVKKMIPSFEAEIAETMDGHAAIRAVSQDRLPIIGPVAKAEKFYQLFTDAAQGATNKGYPTPEYYNGLYIATAFGSRGLAWIPLCAEIIACMINDEPLPLQQSLIKSMHPSRYLMKNLIRQASNKY